MPTTLGRFYQYVRSGGKRPSCMPKLWKKWLWGTNCIAPVSEACGDMNHMHVLGLLLCFMEEAYGDKEVLCVPSVLPAAPLVHLYAQKPMAQYSLRELTTQLECLQLSWGQVLSNCDWDKVDLVLKQLMARLGFLAHRAFPEDAGLLDDPQYIAQLPCTDENDEQGRPLFIITRKCIRQCICIFFSLYRKVHPFMMAHHIVVTARVADELSADRRAAICAMLKQHHVEASMDFYNVLQQMVTLAPGLRLIYRTNFAGMYNDISQVVYFHNPKFARQPQLPTVKEIAATAIHTLPLMTELFPDMAVYYDDDPVIPALTKDHMQKGKRKKARSARPLEAGEDDDADIPDTIEEFVRPFFTLDHHNQGADGASSSSGPRYAWLICCGTVFLIDIMQKTLWASPDEGLLPLVSIFLSASDLAQADDSQLPDDQKKPKRPTVDMSSSHGHITLLKRMPCGQ